MAVPLDYQPPELRAPPHPLAELLRLAVPTVAQMLSYTLMQFLDIWLLARVGDTEAAAAGSSAAFAWSLISFGTGVLFLVNTLVSQHFGQQSFPACGRYLWQGIWWALAYSLLLLALLPIASTVFRTMGHEPSFAAMEAEYFRIVLAGAGLRLALIAHGQFLIATNRPHMVSLAAAVGVAVNLFFAYGLVFGRMGMPQLKVAGAAWATNLGSAAELLVVSAAVWLVRDRQKFNVADFRPRLREMSILLRLGIPSGAQQIAEVLGWSLFATVVVGIFGPSAMASYQYMLRYLIVGFLPCVGIATAVTALVGRYIGMGRFDLAARRAHLGFAVAAVYTIACGALFFFGRKLLIGFFTSDPHVLAMGMTLLAIAAFYTFFDAMFIVYSGALRGAGDTLFPAIALFALCWSIMLGGGYLVARNYPHWGVAAPWGVATVYGILLGFMMLARFRSGRWKLRHLEQPANTATLDDPAAGATLVSPSTLRSGEATG